MERPNHALRGAIPMITATSADPCACCCPDGFACYQTWTAFWDCDLMAWTGPTAGEKTCKATDTSQAWTKTASADAGCTYTKYVRMAKCCTVDGDCTGEADTATPALPASHADCTCPTAVHCTNCSGATPRTWTVTFDSVGNALFKCGSECFFGGITGGTGTLGTYTLTQDAINPCKWTYTGGGPTVLIYHDDPTCSGSPVSYGTITITLTVIGGGGSYRLIVTVANPYTVLTLFDADNDVGDDPDCCTGKTFDNTATYDCGHPGDGGTAVGTPHC